MPFNLYSRIGWQSRLKRVGLNGWSHTFIRFNPESRFGTLSFGWYFFALVLFPFETLSNAFCPPTTRTHPFRRCIECAALPLFVNIVAQSCSLSLSWCSSVVGGCSPGVIADGKSRDHRKACYWMRMSIVVVHRSGAFRDSWTLSSWTRLSWDLQKMVLKTILETIWSWRLDARSERLTLNPDSNRFDEAVCWWIRWCRLTPPVTLFWYCTDTLLSWHCSG